MRSATVELVPLAADASADLEAYAGWLERGPRVVALGHCSNVTGVVHPVAEMAAMAREAGALVVVDAAQSAPHRRLRVKDVDADFVAFSAHKMLGPTGVGVLYASEKHLEELEPAHLGGGTVDWVEKTHYDLRKAPHRFEGGTPNIGGVYGLAAAISYLERIGMEEIEAHDSLLDEALRTAAAQRPYLRMVGADASDRCAIAGLAIDGAASLGDIPRILSDSHGVMARTGHMCAQPFVDSVSGAPMLRISTYLYNDVGEIERAFAALDEACASVGIAASGARG
jgi:cysteine desulfurase/selenocysteine lyase